MDILSYFSFRIFNFLFNCMICLLDYLREWYKYFFIFEVFDLFKNYLCSFSFEKLKSVG